MYRSYLGRNYLKISDKNTYAVVVLPSFVNRHLLAASKTTTTRRPRGKDTSGYCQCYSIPMLPVPYDFQSVSRLGRSQDEQTTLVCIILVYRATNYSRPKSTRNDESANPRKGKQTKFSTLLFPVAMHRL
jgi:hypothetical protein